jgi:hypothetical protein
METIGRYFAKYACWAIILLGVVLSNPVAAQSVSEGPFCGKNFISEGTTGYYWSESGMARCDDDESRTYTTPLAKGQVTQTLKITNFGFRIPANGQIDGIEVVVIRRSDVAEGIIDKSVKLLKNNLAVGNNLLTQDVWDNNWTAAYYGDDQEQWGQTWSANEVNSAGFGVAFEAQCMGKTARPEVDEVLVTVHFTVGSGQAQYHKTTTSRKTCAALGS